VAWLPLLGLVGELSLFDEVGIGLGGACVELGEVFGDDVTTLAPTAEPATKVTIMAAHPEVDDSHSRNDSIFDLSFGLLLPGVGGLPSGWAFDGTF
jgi:hypothetical protein